MIRSTDMRELYLLDFLFFVRRAFKTVYPGSVFLDNWHIEAVINELMDVSAGLTRRLIITQPPRSLKSFIVSVCYPAWLLAGNPSMSIIVVSYSTSLAATFHAQFRSVVEAEWYRRAFPEVRAQKDTGTEFTTTRKGGRFATSVGGTLTGRGGDTIILDDPLNAAEYMSEPARKTLNEWFGGTLVSRLNDKKKGAIILVMQRLHEDDLAGRLLAAGGWWHLTLPAIATEAATIQLGHGRVHRREVGDVLHAEREDRATLDRLKADMGTYVFTAQYQQQPVPVEGNLVRANWFLRYDTLPSEEEGGFYIASWDVAMETNETNDWTVCTIWRFVRGHYYLVALIRKRLHYPDFRRLFMEIDRKYKPQYNLVEDSGLGKALLQDVINESFHGMPPIGVVPQRTKEERFAAQTAKIESGRVHIPRDAHWVDTFLLELLAFPRGRHDDQVDSVSQALGHQLTTYTLDHIYS